MKKSRALRVIITGAVFLLINLAGAPGALAKTVDLLNVSYDPTQKFYEEYDGVFTRHWQKLTGEGVRVRQSHGGSGKQARAVIEGLDADVVTLALSYDIDQIAALSGLLPAHWQKDFPNHSAPYTSIIVFLVRRGNPKNIKDWDDLIKPGIAVITPNPKTSGGARWNYLSAWGYANRRYRGDEAKVMEFMKTLYHHVPVLDSAARGATTTFAQRGIGDVAISWENEAYMAVNELGVDQFQIVVPSVSILAQPCVAVVAANAARHGTTAAAREYLNYLYSQEGQEIAARNYFRPQSAAVQKEFAARFVPVQTLSVDKDFGGWQKAQARHFADGGTFDQIYGQ